ncbi:uncharacterized protein JCM15063_003818 [Sporobolomyces koalae]|uniref:uncharacterized protein n=1 Tax=Sporobolomyces koalae TaxID=500713 RepID=UPI0031759BFD
MPSPKALQRALKAIRAEEAWVSRWLNWVTLACALLFFVLNGQGILAPTTGGKKDKASKSYMGWIGGAIAVSKVVVRWYYVKKRKGIDVLTQYGTGQMQQVFDVCQSALVDLAYHHSLFVTALETTGKGMVDFIVATESLLHSLDNAAASEPADGQLVAKTMKGFREHAGKQTADLVRDELELLNITESECRAFAKSSSEWINPIVLIDCLREKRRPRRSKFRLNVAALLHANFASSSANFKLASAQHASTVLRDLTRQAVSDATGLLQRPGDFGPNPTPNANRLRLVEVERRRGES